LRSSGSQASRDDRASASSDTAGEGTTPVDAGFLGTDAEESNKSSSHVWLVGAVAVAIVLIGAVAVLSTLLPSNLATGTTGTLPVMQTEEEIESEIEAPEVAEQEMVTSDVASEETAGDTGRSDTTPTEDPVVLGSTVMFGGDAQHTADTGTTGIRQLGSIQWTVDLGGMLGDPAVVDDVVYAVSTIGYVNAPLSVRSAAMHFARVGRSVRDRPGHRRCTVVVREPVLAPDSRCFERTSVRIRRTPPARSRCGIRSGTLVLFPPDPRGL